MADETQSLSSHFSKDYKFKSFRNVLSKLDKMHSDNVELLTFNSISKGLTGECGLRGGYTEEHNLDKDVSA